MKELHSVIKRPIMTEKSTNLKASHNCVVFEVAQDANKHDIKISVEKLFKVHVESVRTSIARGKNKRTGKFEGKKPNWKKAVVRIKEGEKIEFFEGV